MGSRFLALGFIEEACNFRFAPVLKGVENLAFDVVSRLYRDFEVCYQ